MVTLLINDVSVNMIVRLIIRELPMDTPDIVHSELSRIVSLEGVQLELEIYRLENESKWCLEVVNEEGTSTVWEDLFDNDQDALDEVMSCIKEEGLKAFSEPDNVVPFPAN